MSLDATTILLLATLLDVALGDPLWLYRAIPHPVAIIGEAIGWGDRRFNRATATAAARRLAGTFALLALLAAAVAAGWAIHLGLAHLSYGWIVEALLMSTLLAQNSLYRHVRAVAWAVESGDLAAARQSVGKIVGRDPETLDESGVGRAALESLAENFSDGVTAPLFWGLLLGLPGMLAYKAINTADSMVGHRTPRHEQFGWAAARCDDLVNLVPARLAGLFIAAAAGLIRGGKVRAALDAMKRDAGRHRSPNAGWPEAAMAGALGVALAGPRSYGGAIVNDGWMNQPGRAAVAAGDIRRGLRLYLHACGLQIAVIALIATIW
ncbi:MAG: adenosylcobinamide-phosphate synthase CbiB [Dongiaceae bacterium]